MSTASLYDNVVQHLGGEAQLRALGVRVYDADRAHVCLKLLHPNPNGVSTVTISASARDLYAMDCFGRLSPESFSAPLIGHAEEIVPENLATVLGRLTGVESLHHHHY